MTALAIALNLEQRGVGKMLLTFDSIVQDFHTHVIFAIDKLRKKNPGAVTRFLRGWFETIAFMPVAISAKVTKTPLAIRAKEYDMTMKIFSDDGKFDAKAVKLLQNSYVELGVLKKIPDAKIMYTEEYLPK